MRWPNQLRLARAKATRPVALVARHLGFAATAESVDRAETIWELR
jgi:hypothetical protein